MDEICFDKVYVYPDRHDTGQVITLHVAPHLRLDKDMYREFRDECSRRGFKMTVWDSTLPSCDMVIWRMAVDHELHLRFLESWQFCEWLMGEFTRIAAVTSAHRVRLSRRSVALDI